jgi:hypothetical protein
MASVDAYRMTARVIPIYAPHPTYDAQHRAVYSRDDPRGHPWGLAWQPVGSGLATGGVWPGNRWGLAWQPVGPGLATGGAWPGNRWGLAWPCTPWMDIG